MNYFPDISDFATGKASGVITSRIDPNKISKGKWYLSVNSVVFTKAKTNINFAAKLSCSLVSSNNTVRLIRGEKNDPFAHLEPLQTFRVHQEDAFNPSEIFVPLAYDRLFAINDASGTIKFYLSPACPVEADYSDQIVGEKTFGNAEACIHYSLYQILDRQLGR